MAYCDIAEAYDQNGSLLPIKSIPIETRAAIVGVEVDDIFEGYGEDRSKVGETVKVKFADKLNALAQIVKIGGWAAPEKMAFTDPEGNAAKTELNDSQFNKLLNAITNPG